MDGILDRLWLAFGHPLPAAVVGLLNLAWWVVFAVALLAVWPGGYAAFGELLSSRGLTVDLPSDNRAIVVLIGFTVLRMVHDKAIARRRGLLDPLRQPAFRTASK